MAIVSAVLVVYLVGVFLALIFLARKKAKGGRDWSDFEPEMAMFSWFIIFFIFLTFIIENVFMRFYRFWYRFFGGKL